MTAVSTTMLDAALEYAHQYRIAVFPVWGVSNGRCGCGKIECEHHGKHPIGRLVPHGFQDATTDEATIRKWWGAEPEANIGTPTGDRIVLDVDPRHGGDETLAALELQHGPLPETAVVHTGGDGRHVHFSKPQAAVRSNAGKLGPGLDIKAVGGYVILPPSTHISGRVYRNDPDHPLFGVPLAPMPQWMMDRLTAEPTVTGGSTNGRPAEDDWATLLMGASEGERHNVAARIAGHYLGKNLPAREVEQIMLGFAGRCTPPFPATEVRKIVQDLANRDAACAAAEITDSWPEPKPVRHEPAKVPTLDRQMLPHAIRDWVWDIAERMQCPPDFPAISALIALATVIGRKLGIRPKRHDDWLVVANLWGMIVGSPGLLKSPAIEETLRPLDRLVDKAEKDHAKALARHQAEAAEQKIRKEVLESQLKTAVKAGGDVESVKQKLAALEELKPPTECRYLTNDSTIEKLGELLNENPNGLLVFRDELSGFFAAMERDGHEQDRPFYLEGWKGTGSFTYDRIGRGTVRIKAMCLSVLGSIQPEPLRAYLGRSFKEGANDGFIQRFQLAVFPDRPSIWRHIDRKPNAAARARAFNVFEALDTLDVLKIGATIGEPLHEEKVPYLHFAPDAQQFFDDWHIALERRLRSANEHPVMIEHLSKFRSLMPSLALVFHLVEGGQGNVSVAAAECAAAWCGYLEAHARRVYQTVIARVETSANLLAAKIKARKLADTFTPREVVKKGWTGLATTDEVIAAAELLADSGWLRSGRSDSGPAGGRSSLTFCVNPRVRTL